MSIISFLVLYLSLYSLYLLTSHFTHFTCENNVIKNESILVVYIRTPNVSIYVVLFSMDLDLFFYHFYIYEMQSSVNINNTMLSSRFDIHLQINNYFAYVIR